MKPFNILSSAWCLSLTAFSFTQAGPLRSRADSPTPTRPFTVAAYASPYPIGQSVTGYNLTARNGNLYLSPKADVQKAVLFVSGDGRLYLDTKKAQPVYIDTYNGLLAYANPPPAGAIFVDFVHLGHGTIIYYQGDGFTSTASGTLEWLGIQGILAWFACGVAGGEYQVYSPVSLFGGTPDINSCIDIGLSALDYSGASPAVDSYSDHD